MKKVITAILSILLLFQCNIIAFAENIATISADTVSLSENESVLIPIKISSNCGIMGFKISVEYPVDKIEIKSVSRGEITAKGNFNTNLGINDGKFDVLWNNTENITGNGTLFTISAGAKTEITKDTEIKLSFSQPDTFNEAWEDVKLNCENIVISAKNIETTVQKGEAATKTSTIIDNSQIIDAVEITLEQNGNENLSGVNDTENFVNDFNDNIEIITGTNEYNASDFDTIKSMYNSAYEDEFIKSVSNNIDTENVQKAVDDALSEFGVSSVEELSDKDKEKFVQKVEENLKEFDSETPNISNELETEDAINIIKKLYDSTSPEPNEENQKENNTKSIIIGVSIAAIIFVSIIVISIIVKKKK